MTLSRWLTVAALALTPPFGSAALAQSPKLDVGFVPTPHVAVEKMLQMAKVQRDDFVIDLGSGDGRIPIAAAKIYGARALGVELDPKLVEESLASAKRQGLAGRVSFRQQDLWKTDISQADVLTLYLFQSMNVKLQPRILDTLRPGSRVVAYWYAMGEWEPDLISGGRIYLWVVPARVAGSWFFRSGHYAFPVTIAQTFQKISGTAQVDGRTVHLQDAVLTGTDVDFVMTLGGEDRRFKGHVNGARIAGNEVYSNAEWTLERLDGQ